MAVLEEAEAEEEKAKEEGCTTAVFPGEEEEAEDEQVEMIDAIVPTDDVDRGLQCFTKSFT